MCLPEPGGCGKDRICYLVPNWSTYEGDLIWNGTIPFQLQTGPVQTEWICTIVDFTPKVV